MQYHIFQKKAKIISNKNIRKNIYRMVLLSSGIAKNALPGQFVNIKVSDNSRPLLRRPLGVHWVKGPYLTILYEVIGEGTKALSKRKESEYLDILGPLGRGFDYNIRNKRKSAIMFVAGGMGIAPLLFLAEKLKTSCEKNIFIGARNKKQLLCEKEFKALGFKVKVATDDGSKGFKGNVTDLLKDFLRTTGYRSAVRIYACGPHAMLKEISSIAKKYNILSQVSLQEHMACGIGACLGCAVETTKGYKRVCKEGPVFNVDELCW